MALLSFCYQIKILPALAQAVEQASVVFFDGKNCIEFTSDVCPGINFDSKNVKSRTLKRA